MGTLWPSPTTVEPVGLASFPPRRLLSLSLASLAIPACGLPGEGAHVYACYGTEDVCRATDPWSGECTFLDRVPTERRVCTDHSDVASTCDRYVNLYWGHALVQENGCRSSATDASRSPLMASWPEVSREATIVPGDSWVHVTYEDQTGAAPILPTSRVSFIDDGGWFRSGRIVVTNLEIHGDATEVDGHSVEQPTIISAEHFRGHKTASGAFALRGDTVSTANWADVEGNYTSFLGLGLPTTTGSVDYAAGRFVLDGTLQGNTVDGDLPVLAEFHLEFEFPPLEYIPFPLDGIFLDPGGQYATAEDVELPDDAVAGFEWYAGAPHLDDMRFDTALLKRARAVELSEDYWEQYDDITLILRTEAGASYLRRFCLVGDGECEDEEDQN